MKGFFSKFKKNKKGYTLTELIVVVAILGVLAVIAVPMIMNSVKDAQDAGMKAQIQNIETAVQLCLADGSLYYVETGGVKVLTPASGTIENTIKQKLVGHKYPVNSKDPNKAANWWFDPATLKVGYDGSGMTNPYKLNDDASDDQHGK
ncbi:prepilin-type N-terminal cleavage/methylation domain-containing protein [Ruminiclostridium herbifermentans]|uniref:Prepilin-type N-terminal cleavage/methylation domain-containing protein n=1 Tax=Ruminiclostridium herbifermentans TaxID=2488810 RepID=A0A4U7J8F1_9FIRM|nr:prepilin-type N-terminal cleavage/methylation domain-containing protein [Ruminiclostridium herbifermentans]QNU68112.1 prepilin-type N-terminal cleavage/methylation domain-containing protein [Ruminiclostridium herbifermentans]